ncbi:hypothetical protein [Calothrix sp. 336/3]|nr:hypothetical protein [Calothrix sp. 336/3]
MMIAITPSLNASNRFFSILMASSDFPYFRSLVVMAIAPLGK